MHFFSIIFSLVSGVLAFKPLWPPCGSVTCRFSVHTSAATVDRVRLNGAEISMHDHWISFPEQSGHSQLVFEGRTVSTLTRPVSLLVHCTSSRLKSPWFNFLSLTASSSHHTLVWSSEISRNVSCTSRQIRSSRTSYPSRFPTGELQTPELPSVPSPSTSSPQFAKDPVNVLLLIADDFKPLLTTFNSPFASKMDNLNRLSEESLTFVNAHSQMSMCGPSRASFLTSLRPDTLGVFGLGKNSLDRFINKSSNSPVLVLPQLFKKCGYATYGIGKVFHESEFNLMDSSEMWTEPMYTILRGLKRPPAFRNPYQGSWLSSPEVADDFYADGQAAQLASRLISQVLTVAESPPWFLAVGFWKPHLPFNAPKKYFDKTELSDYVPTHDEIIEGLKPSQQYTAKGAGCGEVNIYADAPYKLSPTAATAEELSRANQAYHAVSLYMDAQVGIVLDALNSSNARLNTIVVFLGDHGFHLGDHGLHCKHTNFEQATKVPLMIRPPLWKPYEFQGKKSFAPVELLDLMPTLYEMAGLTLDLSEFRPFQGVSLVPVLRDPENASVKKAAMSQYFRGKGTSRFWGYSVRTTRYRFTKWGRKFIEVYDYLEDPWETRQVYDEYVRRELETTLEDMSGTLPFDFDQRFAMNQRAAPLFP